MENKKDYKPKLLVLSVEEMIKNITVIPPIFPVDKHFFPCYNSPVAFTAWWL